VPEHAPEAWSDRERLWNMSRPSRSGRCADRREVEFALPREMTRLRESNWPATTFGRIRDRGMIADLNVHWDMAEDGIPKPMPMYVDHARGGRERFWPEDAETGTAPRCRAAGVSAGPSFPMSALPNSTMTAHRPSQSGGAGIARLSRKTRFGRPQTYRGPTHRRRKGIEPIAPRCTGRCARPMARGSSARFLRLHGTRHVSAIDLHAARHSEVSTGTATGSEQFNAVLGAIRGAPDLVELGKDARGEDRFTTRQKIEAEQAPAPRRELMAERRAP